MNSSITLKIEVNLLITLLPIIFVTSYAARETKPGRDEFFGGKTYETI